MELVAVLTLAGLVSVSGAGVFFGGRYLARRALSPVVRIEPQPVARGQKLTVSVTVVPRQPVQVDQIELTLRCLRTEDSTREDGHLAMDILSSLLGGHRHHYDRYEKDTVCQEHVVYPQNRTLTKVEELRFELDVPRDGFPTDRSGVLTIRWTLRVRFAIPGFPDAIIDKAVEVGR